MVLPIQFDWKHYIGHFVGAFVIGCYSAIFLYIYYDGAYEREMQARGLAEAKQPKSNKEGAMKAADEREKDDWNNPTTNNQ